MPTPSRGHGTRHGAAGACPRQAVGMAPATGLPGHAHAKPWAWHPPRGCRGMPTPSRGHGTRHGAARACPRKAVGMAPATGLLGAMPTQSRGHGTRHGAAGCHAHGFAWACWPSLPPPLLSTKRGLVTRVAPKNSELPRPARRVTRNQRSAPARAPNPARGDRDMRKVVAMAAILAFVIGVDAQTGDK